MYKKLNAKSRDEAIQLIPRLCQCVKLSFIGVSWVENGVEQRLTWEELGTV